jgi:hypothetical protein
LKVVFSGTNTPSKFANIMHVQYASGTPNAANLTTIAGLLSSNYGTNLLAHVHTGVVLTQVVVTDVSSNTGASGIDTTSRAGLLGGVQLPASCAAVISWKIARRYRGGHPRTYLTGINTASQNDVQTLTTTAQTNFNTDATNFRTAVTTMSVAGFTGFQMCNVSYYQGHQPGLPDKPLPRPTPVVDSIIGNHVDVRIDSQRRRLGKGRG